MRVIHAVRELNAQRDEPIRVIALHTEPERHAHVRPPRRRGRVALSTAATSTSTRALERALSRRARRRGLGRLGLRRRAPRVRRAVRAARASCSSAPTPTSCARSATRSPPSGSPSRPACRWRPGAAARSRPPRRRCATRRRIGFPLMIKAAAGGGGRGIRRVDDGRRARRPRSRARGPRPSQAFGDATVLLERLVAPRAPRRGADRSPTATAPRGRSACATAPTSAATRRSSRSPPARR